MNVRRIVNSNEEESYRLRTIAGPRREYLYLPEVFNYATASKVEHFFDPIYLSRHENALIQPQSDLIITESGVSWQKYNSTKFAQTIPIDGGLIAHGDGLIASSDPVSVIELPSACSLLGVHDSTWSHFLTVYLPNLSSYKELLRNGSAYLLTPNFDHDPLLLELIEYSLRSYGISAANVVFQVPEHTHVRVKELFYCSHASYLNEHGPATSEFSAQVSQYSADFLAELIKFLYLQFRFQYPIFHR